MSESELSDIIEKSYSVFRKDNVVHFTKGHGNDGLEYINILEFRFVFVQINFKK